MPTDPLLQFLADYKCSPSMTTLPSPLGADAFHRMLQSSDPEKLPLILDTRATSLFALLHIRSSVPLSLPKLLLKRIQKSTIISVSLEELVVCEKGMLARRATGCPVVVCDETGKFDDLSTITVVNVLLSEGIKPFYLEGSWLADISQFCAADSSLTHRRVLFL